MPIYTVLELMMLLRELPEKTEIMIAEPNPLMHNTIARHFEQPQNAYICKNAYMRSIDVIATEKDVQTNNLPDDWDIDRVKHECKKVLLF